MHAVLAAAECRAAGLQGRAAVGVRSTWKTPDNRNMSPGFSRDVLIS